MRIRSITAFIPEPTEQIINQYSKTAFQMRDKLVDAGIEVQTTRLATTSFTEWNDNFLHRQIVAIEKSAQKAGFDYISIGPVTTGDSDGLAQVTHILKDTENTFCTCQLVIPEEPINLDWLNQVGEVIIQNSLVDDKGFTNLRFAALANVESGCPFFPAAYAHPAKTGFGIAMEAADLALEIFKGADTPMSASAELIKAIEDASRRIEECCAYIAGDDFLGIDFTLAPFPEESRSIGAALESLGISAFGLTGSLSASAFLMSILDQAKFRRIGFNGLMLPILEDSCLAERNSAGIISIQQLLLFSTVCGTGLDCIPLPGSITPMQIASILLDIASLSNRLSKPLTARLMPVPGKITGDMTEFDFGYFANSRIMDPASDAIGGLFEKGKLISILTRNSK